MVWFVMALGLFCRDSYRQVFRWLQPYRRDGTPGRSTLCEARKRPRLGTLSGPGQSGRTAAQYARHSGARRFFPFAATASIRA